MRYAEIIDDQAGIINDEEDPVVQMAKRHLDQAAINRDKQKIRLKQAQERKLKKDLQ